jgi:hypothetical protein
MHPAVIARVSGLSRETAEREISATLSGMKATVFARMLDEKQRELLAADKHRVTITEEFQREFEIMWSDTQRRQDLCPPKDLVTALNRRLEELKKRSISARKLARNMSRSEVPDEMAEVLWRVERLVRQPEQGGL